MGKPSSARTWSVFESTICHYCGGKANSVDHIVPRCLLPKPIYLLPYWFRTFNETPSCKNCNNKKGDLRSDCECPICVYAWNTAEALFMDEGYVRPLVVRLVRSPG